MEDTTDLKSVGLGRDGSNPSTRTLLVYTTFANVVATDYSGLHPLDDWVNTLFQNIHIDYKGHNISHPVLEMRLYKFLVMC